MKCYCNSEQFEIYRNTCGKWRRCLSCGFTSPVKTKVLDIVKSVFSEELKSYF